MNALARGPAVHDSSNDSALQLKRALQIQNHKANKRWFFEAELGESLACRGRVVPVFQLLQCCLEELRRSLVRGLELQSD